MKARGYDKFWKAILTIPVFVAITGGLHYVVSELIGKSDGKFADSIMWDFLDKGITVIFAYVMLSILPEEFQIKDISAKQIRKVKSRLISIRGKILIMLTMFCVLIATSITMISYLSQ